MVKTSTWHTVYIGTYYTKFHILIHINGAHIYSRASSLNISVMFYVTRKIHAIYTIYIWYTYRLRDDPSRYNRLLGSEYLFAYTLVSMNLTDDENYTIEL